MQKLQFQNEILEIYSREKSFIDFESLDLATGKVFFNNSEFARYHDIDGKKILGILTSDIRNKKLVNASTDVKNAKSYTQSSSVLFVRVCDIRGVIKAGISLRLDGELYLVSEAIREGQVWRILLEANK